MGKLKLLEQFQKYNRQIVMKQIHFLFALLLITTNVFSKSYSQTTLSLNFKNTKIENIISFIERRTDYRFLYQTSEIDLKRKISINYRGNISNAVKMLFKESPIYPVIANKQIILKKRVNNQQQFILTGTVTDKDKFPLEGVTVLVNKFQRGTDTDYDGKYKIKVKKGDKVSFSSIGFTTQIFTIENQRVLNVVLKEDVNMLDELVLIGYGKEKRGNIATAISSVKAKTLKVNIQSGSSFDRGLDGLVKGVFVTQGTGELGKNADIIIRGVTSPFNGGNNNPLYVIDGVQISTSGLGGSYLGGNPLQTINPEDIESIDILKDAAATSIYGSRGANGVIIVKTRTGLYDQPTNVTISFKTTFGKPIKTLDYLNAKEFKQYVRTINQNSFDYYKTLTGDAKSYYENQMLGRLDRFGFYLNDFDEYEYDPSRIKFGSANTDWNKVVYRSAAVTNVLNASVRGGGAKSFYDVSLGYLNQEGILRADEKEQYNARLATQFDITEKLKTGVSFTYSKIDLKTGFNGTTDRTFHTLGAGILKFRPDLPVYNADGSFAYDVIEDVNTLTGQKTVTKYPNPLAVSTLSGQGNRADNTLLANVFAEYNITNDLMFKVDYSYGLFLSDSKQFSPKEFSVEGFSPTFQKQGEDTMFGGGGFATEPTLTKLDFSKGTTVNSSINYTLNYTKEFNKNLLKGVLGFSHTEDRVTSDYGLYKDFMTNINYPQYAKDRRLRNESKFNSGLNSYFARASYGYDSKYNVVATVRLDRSSKFAPENRNAFFPSIAASWNIHRENFLTNSFLTELRLRASAGITGSVTVGDFIYVQKFDNQGTVDYNGSPSFAISQEFANTKAKWERTREYNIGLEFRMKKGILRGGIDLYHKTTSDVISNDSEVVETGADQFSRNNAKMENKGFEISLGSDIINTEDFSWSIDVNASKNINKVLKISDVIAKDDVLSSFYVVGREVNLLRGYIVNGIIKTQERIDELNRNAKEKSKNSSAVYDLKTTGVGDYEYKDIDGDGKITSKDGRAIIGSRQPDLFGGFRTNLQYKGIQLSANFSYALGLESARFSPSMDFGRFQNVERYLTKNRWSPTNPSGTLPKLIHAGDINSNANSRPSSVNVYDASYLRLTSLRLGYDLPKNIIENLGFARLNIYVVGTNLATWTSFPGLDPQGAMGGGADFQNTDNYDAYPSAKTVSLGINMQF